MRAPPESRSPRWWRVAVYAGTPLLFGLYAVSLGRDANWDLQNYHWYNAYALLGWRYELDVAPAMAMSFFAPLFYVPWYLLGSILPAWGLGFVIGAVQSCNLLLLYRLGLALCPIAQDWPRRVAALLLALVGMCGGMSLGLLGTTFIDSVVTLGLLGSLLAVVTGLPALTSGSARQAARRAALAALPAAIVVAGKLAVAPFVLGLAAGFLLLPAPLRRRLWLLLWFGLGGTLTTALLLGPWLAQVWSMTGAPFYPFFTQFFDTPFAGPGWGFAAWRPRDLGEALIYPLLIAGDGRRVAEVSFTDLRLALAYVVAPLALLLRLRWPRAARPPLPAGLGYLLAVMAVGYGIWLALYGYYRYAVTLELLAPLAIVLSLAALPVARRARLVVAVGAMALLLATTRPADWGHLPWTARFVEVSMPPIERPESAAVLLMGQPVAFVVPALPPEVAVLEIDMAYWAAGAPAAWSDLIRRRLATRAGPYYAIQFAGWEGAMDRAARPFGLTLDAAGCQPIVSNLPAAGVPKSQQLLLCPLRRLP